MKESKNKKQVDVVTVEGRPQQFKMRRFYGFIPLSEAKLTSVQEIEKEKKDE